MTSIRRRGRERLHEIRLQCQCLYPVGDRAPKEKPTAYHATCVKCDRVLRTSSITRQTGVVSLPIQPPFPQSIESRRLSYIIERLEFQFSPVSLAPRHVGSCQAVDAAANALCYAAHARVDVANGNASNAHGLALRSYSTAVVQLRELVGSPDRQLSDDVLLTIALLSIAEYALPKGSGSALSASLLHFEAMQSVLLARPSHVIPTSSTVARMVLYNCWVQAFYVPCAFNRVSPFENEAWLQLDPPTCDGLCGDFRQIMQLGMAMQVRLPRALRTVRALRIGSNAEASEAIMVCKTLLKLEDLVAETELLRQLRVVLTEAKGDDVIQRVSFAFASSSQVAWSLTYWHCRLMVMRLCLTTAKHAPDAFDQTAMLVAQERTVSNILMSWQWLRGKPPWIIFLIIQPFFECIRALEMQPSFRGLPSAVVTAWIRRQLHDMYSVDEWQDLDAAEAMMN
jgi:hypothetical protein